MNSRRFTLLAGGALGLAVAAVYWNSREAPFLFDDTPAIVDNRTIRHLWPPCEMLNPPADGSSVTNRPMVNFSFAVNYALGGLAVRGYHVMNLLLHALVTLTLWGVLRRTLRLCSRSTGSGSSTRQAGMLLPGGRELAREDRNREPLDRLWALSLSNGQARSHKESPAGGTGRLLPADAESLAWGAALLWAVHPLLTESVTCVVQRTEVLGGLFCLLTLYGFIRSVDGEREIAGSAGAARLKTVGRDRRIPPVPDRNLAGFGDPALQQGGVNRGWQVLTVVFCLLGVVSKEIIVTAPLLVLLYDRTFVAGTFRAAWTRRKPLYIALAATWVLLAWFMGRGGLRGGTVGFGHGVGSWEYLLTQCRALTLYLKLSFWPHPLVVDYGTAVVQDVRDVWAQGLLIVALLLATLYALWRRPVLGFVGAWFFVILAPSSSFVPLITQTIAEHRMYLPLVAVVVLAVAGLHRLAGRHTVIVCLVLATALAIGTVRRNEEYRDESGIWSGVVAVQPYNARAHMGLGSACYKQGDLGAALRHFEESRRLQPRSAQIHYNLGLTLDKLGREEEAAKQYALAVQMAPTLGPAQAELGGMLVRQGRMEEAIQHLQLGLAQAPDLAAAHNSLGQALAATGRIPEAIAAYEAALKIDPALADLHFNLALTLAAAGRGTEALAQYAEAVRLKPAHAQARLNLGIMLAQAGRYEEALAQLREAARLKPALAEAHANLGIVLAETGHPAEAVGSYEAALRLRPDYAVAHYNLGNALVQQQRWTEAKRHFAEAVRLAPDFGAAREMLEKLQAVPAGQ